MVVKLEFIVSWVVVPCSVVVGCQHFGGLCQPPTSGLISNVGIQPP